jgi:hypothetical protein
MGKGECLRLNVITSSTLVLSSHNGDAKSDPFRPSGRICAGCGAPYERGHLI